MFRTAAIALGSNLSSVWGDRRATLEEAVRRVAALGSIRRVSRFYATAPVGYLDQPEFLNGALLLETALEPVDLLRSLLAIERAMGRDRSVVAAKGPRVIDLDVLLMGEAIVRTDELTLPHPRLHERRFVLEPLAEIAQAMVEPVSGLTMADLLAVLQANDPGRPTAEEML